MMTDQTDPVGHDDLGRLFDQLDQDRDPRERLATEAGSGRRLDQ